MERKQSADFSDDGFDFLRNIILASTGSFQGGYHIEFAIEDLVVARNLCDKLAEYDIFANITKGEHIRVYIKDSESICNLLALVKAKRSLYNLNNEIAMRSVRNVSNRRANCDSANILKQYETASRQVDIIKGLEDIPIELQATARARVENPNATYDELGKILGLSKSGVVHRLNKLTNGGV